jgi:hypothetical protein
MDQDETSEKTPLTTHIKTTAEVIVLAYVAATATKGLYDLGKDWKDHFSEKRQAKKELQKN